MANSRFTLVATTMIIALMVGSVSESTFGQDSKRNNNRNTPKNPNNPKNTKQVTVSFSGGSMTINGTKLTPPVTRDDVIKVLGKPDRETPLVNTILTWDNLGIHAYNTPGTEIISAIQVTLGTEDYQFSPKQPYPGSVTVEGKEVTATMTIAELNRLIRPKKLGQTFPGTSGWHLDYGDRKLYLEAGEKEDSEIISLQLDIKAK